MAISIDAMVNEAIKIANDDTHGYSQPRRGGNPDYDCSSLTAHCLITGGFSVDRLSTTSTLYGQLKNLGWKICTDAVKKGDILLTPGKHVVIAISSNQVVTASSDYDNKKGDSSGKEIRVRSYYTPSYGWKYHLRYGGTTSSKFKIGSVYTVQVDGLNVRQAPLTGRIIKRYSKGTRVTCKGLQIVNGVYWMQTPSGWICTYANKKWYVK